MYNQPSKPMQLEEKIKLMSAATNLTRMNFETYKDYILKQLSTNPKTDLSSIIKLVNAQNDTKEDFDLLKKLIMGIALGQYRVEILKTADFYNAQKLLNYIEGHDQFEIIQTFYKVIKVDSYTSEKNQAIYQRIEKEVKSATHPTDLNPLITEYLNRQQDCFVEQKVKEMSKKVKLRLELTEKAMSRVIDIYLVEEIKNAMKRQANYKNVDINSALNQLHSQFSLSKTTLIGLEYHFLNNGTIPDDQQSKEYVQQLKKLIYTLSKKIPITATTPKEAYEYYRHHTNKEWDFVLSPSNYKLHAPERLKRSIFSLLFKLRPDFEVKGSLEELCSFLTSTNLLIYTDLFSELSNEEVANIIQKFSILKPIIDSQITEKKAKYNHTPNIISANYLENIDDLIGLSIIYSTTTTLAHIILGPDNALKLINQNQAGLTINKRTILKEATDVYINMLSKITTSVPIIKGITKGITYETSNFQDQANIIMGVRIKSSNSCLRLGGAQSDYFKYCLTNPNGFVINLSENGEFIGRIAGFRRGNTIQLTRMYLDKPIDSEAVLQAIGNDIIASANKEDHIDYVFTIPYNSLVTKAYKTFPIIKDEMFDTENILPNIATDHTGIIGLISSTVSDPLKHLEKIQLDETHTNQYIQPRQPVSKHVTQENLKILNKIRAINSYIETDPTDFICKNLTSYQELFLNNDWYIAITSEGEIESVILPYDQRAIAEYEEALIQIQTISKTK